MAKLILALPLFALVLATVWCDVEFTITKDGEKDVGTKYEDIKTLIMTKYGHIMTKDGVMPQFSELNQKALEDPRFAEISAKVQKGEELTDAEDEEFVKLHFKYFGALITKLYEDEDIAFTYSE
uniref:Uncharacterized protein n=1 Tax=Strigamia maritima TaxID=126957 RepID=T1JDE9_STRMM